jgi:hypothetical protein
LCQKFCNVQCPHHGNFNSDWKAKGHCTAHMRAETRHRDAGPAMMKPLTAPATASSSMDSLAVSQRGWRERERERRKKKQRLAAYSADDLSNSRDKSHSLAALPLQHQDSTKAGRRYVGAQVKRQRRPWAPLPTTFLLRALKPTWIPAELC